MAEGHPPAAAMAIRASYRRSRLPFAPARKSHHKATAMAEGHHRPQQWLKGTPRPQQWLLIGVQGCRLPGLKPSKSPPSSAGKRYPNKPSATIRVRSCRLPALKGLKRSAAASTMATAICYSYRRSRLPFAHPQRPETLRGSFDQALRPQPSAAIGVRGCRLPTFKGLNVPRQLRPGTRGHSHLLLSAFEAAVCRTSEA